jgi:hypothetical protein
VDSGIVAIAIGIIAKTAASEASDREGGNGYRTPGNGGGKGLFRDSAEKVHVVSAIGK